MNQTGNLRFDGIKGFIFILYQQGKIITYSQLHEISEPFPQDGAVFTQSKHGTLHKLVLQSKNPTESFGINSFSDHRQFIQTITESGLEIKLARYALKSCHPLYFSAHLVTSRE